MNEFDDIITNPTQQSTLYEVTDPQRRKVILASAISALFAALPEVALTKSQTELFTFKSVPFSLADDNVHVPDGYRWAPVATWGDSIYGQGQRIRADVSDTYLDQEKQFGMHHDGCAFFPIKHQGSDSIKGLWVVNHEYTDDGLLHADGMENWSAEKVKKSQAAHGVAVCAIERSADGSWKVVQDERARRITAYSPCDVSGPAAGHALLKTQSDPTGKRILGTMNNCANGVTPWGTYLTCEENFNGYFSKKGKPTLEEARVGITENGFGYRWHEHDERFSLDKHPNEAHRFGWVVEIDPQDPQSMPVKRTALGRFKHEGAKVVLGKNNKIVVYLGDDQRNEYIYKYVSKGTFNPKLGKANARLLDEGTLYVARYDANGQGQWLALEHGKNGLTPENGFPDQAYVLVHARIAADFLGATPMDRCEWIAVNPINQDVYATLTNNSDRGTKIPLNAANPRVNNAMGHIIKWSEQNADSSALQFKWEIYVLAGDSSSSKKNVQGNIKGDAFGSPDGLWFDKRGILWTETDISTNSLGKGDYVNFPNNSMYASNPITREYRRFLIGPKGCEITGIDMTPDLKTMFINIQHPGETASERSNPKEPKAVSSWPDFEKFSRPRSSTIAIWREDGKVIGS